MTARDEARAALAEFDDQGVLLGGVGGEYFVQRRLAAALRALLDEPINDAQIEAAAQAFSLTIYQIELVWTHMKEQDRGLYREAARVALEAARDAGSNQ